MTFQQLRQLYNRWLTLTLSSAKAYYFIISSCNISSRLNLFKCINFSNLKSLYHATGLETFLLEKHLKNLKNIIIGTVSTYCQSHLQFFIVGKEVWQTKYGQLADTALDCILAFFQKINVMLYYISFSDQLVKKVDIE